MRKILIIIATLICIPGVSQVSLGVGLGMNNKANTIINMRVQYEGNKAGVLINANVIPSSQSKPAYFSGEVFWPLNLTEDERLRIVPHAGYCFKITTTSEYGGSNFVWIGGGWLEYKLEDKAIGFIDLFGTYKGQETKFNEYNRTVMLVLGIRLSL